MTAAVPFTEHRRAGHGRPVRDDDPAYQADRWFQGSRIRFATTEELRALGIDLEEWSA